MISIWIEPHERREAIEAYKDWLTQPDIEMIESAPEDARILIRRAERTTAIGIIE